MPGLYFIGEVMDVTGWLGGYNFQWAWSSAWACAQETDCSEVVLTCYLKMKIIRAALKMS